MEFLVGAALALLSATVLAYPFFTHRGGHRPRGFPSPAGSPAQSAELEEVYRAIRELRWERQTGDLPEDLYQQQLNSLRRQAARLLRGEATAVEAEQALEREVAAELAQGQAPPGKELGA
jgi:hypothetical protein